MPTPAAPGAMSNPAARRMSKSHTVQTKTQQMSYPALTLQKNCVTVSVAQHGGADELGERYDNEIVPNHQGKSISQQQGRFDVQPPT